MGIKVETIGDLPAMAVLVGRILRQIMGGDIWQKLREVAGKKICADLLKRSLLAPRSKIAQNQKAAIENFLEFIVPTSCDAPLMSVVERIRSPHGDASRSGSKDDFSLLVRKPRPSRAARLHSPATKANEDKMKKAMRRTASSVNTQDQKMMQLLQDAKAAAEGQIPDSDPGKPYEGLQHNPYVGSIRHAPNRVEPDIFTKVYLTAKEWLPEQPCIGNLIPMAARVLQLVSFEATSGRHGQVDEVEVAICVMEKLVDEAAWNTEEDRDRALYMMDTTVRDAIGSRLTLSTIEAIVTASEKQVVRRKLEENIPYMAVMGLENRINHEASCSEEALTRKHRIDNLILTIDLIYSVMVALVPMFLVGYNTSVLNSPEGVIFPGHSKLSWSLAVSVFAIGGPFGALAGGMFANIFGRRLALTFNMSSFLVGGLALSLAPNMITIIAARVVIGFASGFATVLVPVYMGELSPPSLRGTFGTMSQLSMVMGILGAATVSLWCTTPEGWRYLFGVTPAVALVALFSLSSVKESPRWLYSHSTLPTIQRRFETARLLMQLRGFRDEQEVSAELMIFEDAIRMQKTDHSSAHGIGAMVELLFDSSLRRLIICTLVLQMTQQFCGINAVFYYSTQFLSGAVSDPLVGSVLIAFVNVIATYWAAKIMDNFKRKELLVFSALGMLISCVGITFALDKRLYFPGGFEGKSILALISTALYVTMFELGLGPIPWLISSEMFDPKNVATAQSLASQMNWICNFAVGLGFPFLAEYLKGLTFVPFAGVLLFTAVFVTLYVPETAGVNSHQVLAKTMSHKDLEKYRKLRAMSRHTSRDFRAAGSDGLLSPGRTMTSAKSYGSFGDAKHRRSRSKMSTMSTLRRRESFKNLFYKEIVDG